MELNQVLNAINKMDSAELTKVFKALKQRRSSLAQTKTLALDVGDTVRVVGGKIDGRVGEIIKVNQKTVLVDLDGQRWKIPSTMLELV